MGLWATMPDGTSAHAIFGNYTRNPECFFEARAVPNSHRFVVTAAGHHSITAGSLILLDPNLGHDVAAALTRLTPGSAVPGERGPADDVLRQSGSAVRRALPGGLERQAAAISGGAERNGSVGRLPVRRIRKPHFAVPRPGDGQPISAAGSAAAPPANDQFSNEGGSARPARVLLLDVHQGLEASRRGTIKRLEDRGDAGEDAPHDGLPVNWPDEPRLGPFRAGHGASGRRRVGILSGSLRRELFRAGLDADGAAVQTMRSGTYLQPGQTVTCVGCHEPRVDVAAERRTAGNASRALSAGTRAGWIVAARLYGALCSPCWTVAA